MASLQVQCPRCGQWATIDSAFAGRTVACPQCRQAFAIAQPLGQPAPTAAAAQVQSPFAGGRPTVRHNNKGGWIVAIFAGVLLMPVLVCGGCLMLFSRAVHEGTEAARREEAVRSNQAGVVSSAKPQVKLSPPKFAIFADPRKVAVALANDGLPPRPHFDSKQIWGNPFDGEYFFITDDVEVTLGRLQHVGDVANTIGYDGNSRVVNQIESVELELQAFNARTTDAAVERYKATVGRLFERLNLEMPDGLLDAVGERRPFAADEPYGKVKLTRDENKPGFGFRLNLTIDVATE